MGMDMYAAEIVLELRQTYPWIGLEMVIPYDSQADRWEEVYQTRYTILLEAADIVTCTGHEYTKGALFRRNRYLVDNADLLLAAYDGQPGGTQMTCEYAKKVGVEVCKIPPVVVKPKSTPVAADKEDREVDELLRGSLELFKEVQQLKPEPGKTYSVDCPFCNAVDGMDFSLSTLNSHLHAHCAVCHAAVMQ